MGKRINIIGATGLVGRELLKQLLNQNLAEHVVVFARRASGLVHPKLEEHLINFENEEEWRHLVKGDVLFSTLGTTLKQAGSKSAQYQVDYTFQYRFAEVASRNGVPVYVLVSSTGASSKSPFFYARMKGELDEAVGKLPFERCVILRPSILAGPREIRRPAEALANSIMKFLSRFVFRKYRPVPAEVVAAAMINAAFYRPQPGVTIADTDEIFTLAPELTSKT
jgi:uncharacterized protein YbjT (DUF2867 family)